MDLDLVPTRPGDRPVVMSGSRVCAADGCTTVLSRYNVSPRCFAHQEGGHGESPV